MAYHFDQYDGSLVFDGVEKGIAESPTAGISDMRNVNIISIPTEASVNFSTDKISYSGMTTGTITSANAATDYITFTGATGIEDWVAIRVLTESGLSLTVGQVYYVRNKSGSTCQLYDKPIDNVFYLRNVTNGTGTFAVIAMATPKHFVWTGACNYLVDSAGLVWTDSITTTSGYWVYTGNSTTPNGDSAGNANGNGLVFYQKGATGTTYNDGDGYLFVFRNSAIDYLTDLATGWVYGWKPSDGTTANGDGYLETSAGVNNSHEAILAPTNQIVYCDNYFIGRFYQKAIGTVFNPTVTTSYVWDVTALLPSTDKAQCLAYLGSNYLIGGQKNVIYPWNGYSTTFNYPLLLAEYSVSKMVTVNTNTYLFIGNRGRIYVTNGTNVQLYKKLPDHISGTVEPYYAWGGAVSSKNQLYFGALATTNSGSVLSQYGGLWAVDLDTNALRLVNKLSYDTYAGFVSAVYPDFSSTNPAGAGLFIGWNGSIDRTLTDAVTTAGSLTMTSATGAFTSADMGKTVVASTLARNTSIVSINSSTSVVLSQQAEATGSALTAVISTNGLDTSASAPYTNSEAIIDFDLVPIGTYTRPKDMTQIEYKLSRPLVSGESVTIKTRLIFNTSDTGYTTTYSDSTVGKYSGVGNVNFKNAQWMQIQVVLNSTASSPSFVRLKEVRVLGLTGIPQGGNE